MEGNNCSRHLTYLGPSSNENPVSCRDDRIEGVYIQSTRSRVVTNYDARRTSHNAGKILFGNFGCGNGHVTYFKNEVYSSVLSGTLWVYAMGFRYKIHINQLGGAKIIWIFGGYAVMGYHKWVKSPKTGSTVDGHRGD